MCEYPTPGNIECYFSHHENQPTLYANKLLAVDISGGSVDYDGYFHVEPEQLPLKYTMCLSQTEAEPYKVENNCSYYKYKFNHLYLIEIYRKEVFESTNQYSDEIDEDGEPMSICFFPTNRERIWFRVLEFVDHTHPTKDEQEKYEKHISDFMSRINGSSLEVAGSS